MQRKYLPIILLLLLACCTLGAQTLPDSLQKVVQEMVKEEVTKQLWWPYRLGLVSIFGVTAYAVYMFLVGIKKKAETVMEEQLSSTIAGKISQELGVKSELIKSYFKRIEADQAILGSRILILSKVNKKDITLNKKIKDGGFTEPPINKLLADLQEDLDINAYDLVLFDNRDGQLSEGEATTFIDQYPTAFAYVCYTSDDWSGDNYLKYSKGENPLKFVKDASYLTDVMKNALK